MSGVVLVNRVDERVGFVAKPANEALDVVVVEVVVKGGGILSLVVDAATTDIGCWVAPAKSRPGVKGCVSSKLRSESAHRICNAGAAVKVGRPDVVGTNPQMPPLKSVVSEVQAKPLELG